MKSVLVPRSLSGANWSHDQAGCILICVVIIKAWVQQTSRITRGFESIWCYHYSVTVILWLKASLRPSLQHIKTLQLQCWHVSFWTLLRKQQFGIVIEQLNDDENEWKTSYEFPACRHSHASQVWFQEQLCGFNLPLCFLHASTHPHVHAHTYVLACT